MSSIPQLLLCSLVLITPEHLPTAPLFLPPSVSLTNKTQTLLVPVSEQLKVARRKQPYLLTSLQVGPRTVEQPSSISCPLKHLTPLQPPPASPCPHALAVYFTENLEGNLLTFPQAYPSVCFVSPCPLQNCPYLSAQARGPTVSYTKICSCTSVHSVLL